MSAVEHEDVRAPGTAARRAGERPGPTAEPCAPDDGTARGTGVRAADDDAGRADGAPITRLLRHLGTRPRGVVRRARRDLGGLVHGAVGPVRRDRETPAVAICFADLAGFWTWAAEAGDDRALPVMRDVASALEGEVRSHGGEVVKWHGGGMLAVLPTAEGAVAAVRGAVGVLGDVDRDGHVPRLSAGVHVGAPTRVGHDYLGVDVNIAARVADVAEPGQACVTDSALGGLDEAKRLRSRRALSAPGVPSGIGVHAVSLR